MIFKYDLELSNDIIFTTGYESGDELYISMADLVGKMELFLGLSCRVVNGSEKMKLFGGGFFLPKVGLSCRVVNGSEKMKLP